MSAKENKETETVKALPGGKVRILLVIAAVLLLSALAIGARTLMKAQFEVLEITVNTNGFTSSETTRAAGGFRLSLINQSGAEGLTLRLMRDGGELVQELVVPKGTSQLSTELKLPAGGYTLTEAAHPAWLFHITAQ